MIKEVLAKSILTRNKYPEGWFGVQFNMNLYRGCQHGCIYCDSRSDCYHIEDFDNEIIVKINGPELLEDALRRKRSKVLIGSGSMSDCYMPIEKHYKLMQQSLEIMEKYKMMLHVSTKSDLILRDIDLIEKISKRYASIAVTITTADDELAKVIEPHAPSSTRRFEVVKEMTDRGIICGLLLMPQLPYLMEDRKHVDGIIEGAVKAGAKFIFPSFGMTLRSGQREYFYEKLDAHYDGLSEKYKQRFGDSYGVGCVNYDKMKPYFTKLCKENGIMTWMPYYEENNLSTQLSLFDD